MVVSFCKLPVFGQLNTDHNHMRPGDVLVKQQVEYKDPGKAGKNLVWDFSKLKTVNDQYTLTYSLPPLEGDSVYIVGDTRFPKKKVGANELVIGTEHNTMYFYRLKNDSLLQLGHENPSIQLEYTIPMVTMQYPLNYGQTISSGYKSKGLYSGTVDMENKGTITTTADAYGKMILPSGDTLSPVLRVKTIQTIIDVPNQYSYNPTGKVDLGKSLETCRWYSKGYRYPVFETIRDINIADSTEIFSTAFFFPPQEHLYLDTDPENLALLEKLWDVEKENESTTNKDQSNTVSVADIMICRIYPNPVETIMNLEYELKEDTKVSFEIYSLDGMLVKKLQSKPKKAGSYNESIDCSSLSPKNYVLRITANGALVNQVIIKK